MCTIGAVYDKGLILFKNCDLAKKTKFFKPKIKKGKYKYIAFTRKGRPGIWAGINEFGLGIVAADTYTKKKYKAKPYTIYNIFKGYEKAISDFNDVNEVEKFLKEYYFNKISIVPDLLIIADKTRAKVIEFTPKRKWITRTITSGFILRSNHFILSKGALPREKLINSYLRYETGLKLLKKDKSLDNIFNLCRNHTNGPSLNSICRHGGKGKFNTQASAIMVVKDKITAYYIVNNYPCKVNFNKMIL